MKFKFDIKNLMRVVFALLLVVLLLELVDIHNIIARMIDIRMALLVDLVVILGVANIVAHSINGNDRWD